MKTIQDIVTKVIRPVAQKHGFIAAKIIMNWHHIVGLQTASFCMPIKIIFKKKQKDNARLKIIVDSGHALTFSYNQELIIEQINSYFGYKLISDLLIVQKPYTRKSNVNEEILQSNNYISVNNNTEDKQLIAPMERLENALKDLKILIQGKDNE